MRIERQLRMLQLYTAALTILLLVMLVSAFQKPRPKFEEIDVERINIVEADGKLRMTISNQERVPDPVINGNTYAGARRGSRARGSSSSTTKAMSAADWRTRDGAAIRKRRPAAPCCSPDACSTRPSERPVPLGAPHSREHSPMTRSNRFKPKHSKLLTFRSPLK